MKHIPSLDGIRGLAILMVIAFHFMERRGTGVFGASASMGWVGVDIFLVLSGYLITSILWEQRGAVHFYRNFYIRRGLRLFPLYYLILFGTLALTPILHIHWYRRQIMLFLYSTNYMLPYIAVKSGNVGPFNLFHTWTLALEEQFYFVWPWLVGNLALSRRRLLQICVAGMVLAPVIRFFLLSSAIDYTHIDVRWLLLGSLPTRMDTLLTGATLALMPLPSLRTARLVFFAMIPPLALIAYRAKSLNQLSPPMEGIGFSLVGLACAAFVVLSMYPTTLVHRIANLSFLRFYGKYSYGIYLWHYFFSWQFFDFRTWVLDHSSHRLPASLFAFLVLLLVSTLIGVASYRFIEAPFLSLKPRFER